MKAGPDPSAANPAPEGQHRKDVGSPAQPFVTRERIAAELARAREATHRLLAPIPDDELVRQISPLQSPLVWDYAHIAYFEELWLLRRVCGDPPLHGHHDDLYNAFAHARGERADLPILAPAAARAYADTVRTRVLDRLDEVQLGPHDPLLDEGFVFGMVVQHELQHQETMLQTLSLGDFRYDPPPRRPAPDLSPGRPETRIDTGVFLLGADDEPWAYDNERPRHERALDSYWIDRLPVSYGEFAAFVAEGYGENAWWSDAGVAWRDAEGARGPLHVSDGVRRRFGSTQDVPAHEPVQHVSWYEAEAYARWVGRRLPTEAEWEVAVRQGALAGVGSVWEWTSSPFEAYPGFRAFPYPEYSEVFFGPDHRVLRGASWATDPLVGRVSFRNWDFPQRRQIFSGFRCARDA